jgi:hypothetical protein
VHQPTQTQIELTELLHGLERRILPGQTHRSPDHLLGRQPIQPIPQPPPGTLLICRSARKRRQQRPLPRRHHRRQRVRPHRLLELRPPHLRQPGLDRIDRAIEGCLRPPIDPPREQRQQDDGTDRQSTQHGRDDSNSNRASHARSIDAASQAP